MITKFVSRALPVLVVLISLSSSAAIIPQFLNSFQSAPGVYTFRYSAALDAESRLDSGPDGSGLPHFFTIYDISGYIEGSAFTTNDDFDPSEQFLGINGYAGVPEEFSPDDPTIYNVTFTWDGDPSPVIGPQPLGEFTIDSIFPAYKLEAYRGQTTKNAPDSQNPDEDGTRDANQGSITVPSGVIPEPGTYVMLGSGLLLLGVLRKKFSNS